MLPCFLSSYMFVLPLVFPQATQKYLFLRHDSIRCDFLQRQTTHFSPLYHTMHLLLRTCKPFHLFIFCWLWLHLLSLGFILSFAGFLTWILCILLFLITNGILLFLNLIVLHELVISFLYKLMLFLSEYLFQICHVLLLKRFTSWHNFKVGNFETFPQWIIHSSNMLFLPDLLWLSSHLKQAIDFHNLITFRYFLVS